MFNLHSVNDFLPDLESSFGVVDLPKTVDMGAQGTAQLIITNKGKKIASDLSKIWVENLALKGDFKLALN